MTLIVFISPLSRSEKRSLLLLQRKKSATKAPRRSLKIASAKRHYRGGFTPDAFREELLD